VPNTIGHTLTRAAGLLRTAALRGVAFEHDPQFPAAVVVAQEPPAGLLVPRCDVVGVRTSTDVQANGSPRRLRLPRGSTTATYPVVAPDPARQRLTVVVAMRAAVELQVWLATAGIRRLSILDTSNGTAPCQGTGGRSRCVVGVGTLDGEDPGCGPPPLPSSRPRQRRSRSRSPSRPADPPRMPSELEPVGRNCRPGRRTRGRSSRKILANDPSVIPNWRATPHLIARILEQPSLTQESRVGEAPSLCSQPVGRFRGRRIGVMSLNTNGRWSKPCDRRSVHASLQDCDATALPPGQTPFDDRATGAAMLSCSAKRPMWPLAWQRSNRCQERDVGEVERGDGDQPGFDLLFENPR
jgi:hypothetical protein